MKRLRERLETLAPAVLPQSPLGKAVNYGLAEWKLLQAYLEDGQVEIDNNLIENAIRPTAVGKKNGLFFGHPEAAWRSAVIYSIVGSCRRRGINPEEYRATSSTACRPWRPKTSTRSLRQIGNHNTPQLNPPAHRSDSCAGSDGYDGCDFGSGRRPRLW